MRPIASIAAVMIFAGATGAVAQQSPGGVSGAEAWFDTSYDSSTRTYKWKDRSGNRLTLFTRGPKSEVVEFRSPAARTINFNDALDFSRSDTIKWISFADAPLTQSTVIGVYHQGIATAEGSMWSFASGDGLGASASDRKIYGAGRGGGLDYNGLFATGAGRGTPRILTYHRASIPETSPWGSRYGSMMTVCSPKAAEQTFLGRQFGDSTLLSGFRGYVPELIVYNRILTPFERKKVECYLAMRYGLTIDCSYVDAAGNEIWDKDAGYHNRVTALVRDEANGFIQTESATSCEDPDLPNFETGRPLLTMWAADIRPMGYNDILIWGDDNGAIEDWCDPEGLWKVFPRKWKINCIPAVCKIIDDEYVPTGDELDIANDTDYEIVLFPRHTLSLDSELIRTRHTQLDNPNRLKLIINGECPDFLNPDELSIHNGSVADIEEKERSLNLGQANVCYHDIVWDIDGNGYDYFTFGFFLGMEAKVRVTPLGLGEENTGSIDIKILLGDPEYRYTLMPERLDEGVISEGFFSEDSQVINGLNPGKYYLRLEQGYHGTELEGLGSLYFYITIGPFPFEETGAEQLYGPDIPWELLTDRDRDMMETYSAQGSGRSGRGHDKGKDILGGKSGDNSHAGIDSPAPTGETELSVSRLKGTGYRYEARIVWSGAVSLAVYDAQGRLVTETEMEGDSEKRASFEVPAAGVYVVRAITEEGDHTVKLMVK